MPALAARGGSPRAEQLVARMYPSSKVTPQDLTAARDTVRVILKDAAIVVLWHDCPNALGLPWSHVTPCDHAPDAQAVIVRIIAAADSIGVPHDVLGYSVINLQEGESRLITIFADRVEVMAHAANVDMGRLLGRAIAHELGHILLGTTDHSDHGLMRAVWTGAELRRDLLKDWTLSRNDAARMRRGLLERSQPTHAAIDDLAVRGGPLPAGD